MGKYDSDGSWIADDGRRYDSPSADPNSGGGGGGGAMPGMAGGFLLIFILGPIIAAKIVGWLWGMLLKLGIVGKIITTALLVVAGPTIAFSLMSVAREAFTSEWVLAILLVGSTLIIPTWYYFWHYDVAKEMGASEFSNKIKNLTMFIWFGFIGSWIIGAISKGDTNKVAGIVFIIATIAGFVYYILSTRAYAQDVERTKSFKFRWIGLAVSVGLAALLLSVAQSIGTANRNAKYVKGTIFEVVSDSTKILTAADLESETLLQVRKGDTLTSTGTVTRVKRGKSYYNLVPVDYNGNKGWIIGYQMKQISYTVSAQPAKNKKQKQTAAEYASGTVLLVNTNGEIKLYEEANDLSKVVMQSLNKGGEKFISNGEVVFDGWKGFVPVSYNGVNAWASTREVSPIMGIATVVSDKTVFRPRTAYDDKGDGILNPVSHPDITLKKGDTFEVLSVSKDFSDGIYNGKLGFVKSSDITVAKGQ